MQLEGYIMWFRKKVQPTFMQRLMKFKTTIVSIAAILGSLTYFYGFVQPNFQPFKQTEIQAVAIGQGLFVQIESNKIPDVPVTVSFIVDGIDIAHRHYSLGIPSIKGVKFQEGKATWIEPIPLLFTFDKPEVTVRFSFQGLKTLLVPTVITFNTEILDGNQAQGIQENKDLFKGIL